MKAIIVGTGVDAVLHDFEKKIVETVYGDVEVFVHEELVILPRHKSGHAVPPHKINYRANIQALKDLGVDEAIGTYAVGSISTKLKPGEVGFVSDFLDFTQGRESTFFNGENNRVKHTPMDTPFSLALQNTILSYAPSMGVAVKDGGVYVCTNGPRFETKAEIRMYALLGGDIVGMTGCPEIALLKEMNINYAALAFSINWGCGIEQNNLDFLSDQKIAQVSTSIMALAMKSLIP